MQLVDALAGPQSNVKDEVKTVTLWFTYLGVATLVAHFLETALFMWSGELLAQTQLDKQTTGKTDDFHSVDLSIGNQM